MALTDATVHFYSRLGVLLIRNFFESAFCAQLKREVRSSPTAPASVVKTEGWRGLLTDHRRTDTALPSEGLRNQVVRRLRDVGPRLGSHFQVELRGIQDPQFLIYREGHFFNRHVDNSSDADAPDFFRARQVSVSVL